MKAKKKPRMGPVWQVEALKLQSKYLEKKRRKEKVGGI
jgi:hypothetical protein